MSTSPAVFSALVHIRWGDSDRLGHVNNVRVVDYMQEARVQFMTRTMLAAGVHKGSNVVRKTTVEFLRTITDDSGPLTVEMSVLQIGTTSFTIRHRIIDRHGVLCAFGDAVMVGFDRRTERPVAMTPDQRSALAAYLHSDADSRL